MLEKLIGIPHLTSLLMYKENYKAERVSVQFFTYRQLSTNKLLQQIGLEDNDKCTLCQAAIEKLAPLFWYCDEITLFWNCVRVFFKNALIFYPKLTDSTKRLHCV